MRRSRRIEHAEAEPQTFSALAHSASSTREIVGSGPARPFRLAIRGSFC